MNTIKELSEENDKLKQQNNALESKLENQKNKQGDAVKKVEILEQQLQTTKKVGVFHRVFVVTT